jgi:menaquinol-cytochrome c reductase iron-sulfur subunit
MAIDRRALLKRLLQAAGALVAAVVGIPSLVAGLSPALRGRPREDWRDVGAVDQFAVGATTETIVRVAGNSWPRPVAERAVYVWRPSAEQIVVFSRSCTDLGCPLNYDPGSRCFFCPCHGGIFGQDGRRMAGPPDRPMHRYAIRIREGVLEINLSSVPPMA